GMITQWNTAAERIFGYSTDQIIGQPLTVLMPERFHVSHRQGWERYRSTGVPHVIGKTVELAGRRADGTEFPLELSLATWKTSQGTFFTGLMRDISERKQAEEDLRAANKELEAFSYSVSHDLRAPLRQISGFAEILSEEYGPQLDAKGQQYLNLIS